HGGSKQNLLGAHPSADDLTRFSNEIQVTPDTPPAFLVHAEDDTVVPIANSETYADALKRHGTAETCITYPQGAHGLGLHNKTPADKWFDLFLEWLAGI